MKITMKKQTQVWIG